MITTASGTPSVFLAFAAGPVPVGSPCVLPLVPGSPAAISGPTADELLGATEGTVAKGGGLLAVYSAGLAVPFLVTAIAFNRATTAFAWVKRHYAVINGLAGVLLIAIGVLGLSGELFRLNIETQKFLDKLNLNFFQNV